MSLSGTTLLYILFITFIVGLVGAVLVWIFKNKYYKGKIKCIFYTQERTLEIIYLKPGIYNHFVWRNGHYLYDPRHVKSGRNPFGDLVPVLTFIQGYGWPVEPVSKYATNINELATARIRADFRDKTARELGGVSLESKRIRNPVSSEKLYSVMLYGFIIIGAITLISFYFLSKKI